MQRTYRVFDIISSHEIIQIPKQPGAQNRQIHSSKTVFTNVEFSDSQFIVNDLRLVSYYVTASVRNSAEALITWSLIQKVSWRVS